MPDGSRHRTGILAIFTDSLVLFWKHGPFWRKQSWWEATKGSTSSWDWSNDGRLTIVTSTGTASIEWLPGSEALAEARQRMELIRPFGNPR
jgi:hypothetical protein